MGMKCMVNAREPFAIEAKGTEAPETASGTSGTAGTTRRPHVANKVRDLLGNGAVESAHSSYCPLAFCPITDQYSIWASQRGPGG